MLSFLISSAPLSHRLNGGGVYGLAHSSLIIYVGTLRCLQWWGQKNPANAMSF